MSITLWMAVVATTLGTLLMRMAPCYGCATVSPFATRKTTSNRCRSGYRYWGP